MFLCIFFFEKKKKLAKKKNAKKSVDLWDILPIFPSLPLGFFCKKNKICFAKKTIRKVLFFFCRAKKNAEFFGTLFQSFHRFRKNQSKTSFFFFFRFSFFCEAKKRKTLGQSFKKKKIFYVMALVI